MILVVVAVAAVAVAVTVTRVAETHSCANWTRHGRCTSFFLGYLLSFAVVGVSMNGSGDIAGGAGGGSGDEMGMNARIYERLIIVDHTINDQCCSYPPPSPPQRNPAGQESGTGHGHGPVTASKKSENSQFSNYSHSFPCDR